MITSKDLYCYQEVCTVISVRVLNTFCFAKMSPTSVIFAKATPTNCLIDHAYKPHPQTRWLKMAGILFEDIFDVKDIDPDGKKFERGTCTDWLMGRSNYCPPSVSPVL